jgi:ATP-dependent helicase/nuclease subunit A
MSQLTPAQQAAIEARGNVLVVAGAGTGKTRTLVDRCVALLEGGESLEHLLLVTFTDAAAAEMRQRIREALLERLARDQDRRGRPEPEHWEHQLAVLDSAWISTLHSLCLELVRRHFHDLAIDPEISVLDETQTRPLLRATLDALFERHCLEGAPTFATVQNLIRRHGDGSDAGLRRLLLQIHRYTQTLPDPEGWMARQRERFARADPAFWRETLVGAVRDWRAFWRPDLAEFAGTPNVAACLQALEGLPAEATPNDCAALLRKVREARAGPWPHGSVGKVRDLIADFFDEAEFLCSQAEDDAQALADEWAAVREHMSALLELARELTADFSRAKRALGGVDFADLEQFSLRLLWDTPDGDPSAIARRWRDQFHFVFVDEYQDINPAQEAILRALSREGAEANRFLVGDVKQSIYRFRLANPRIFADYERRWRNHPREGRCLDLADNFRSREALLDFVNSLFASLLHASVGGVDYGSGAALRFGDPAGRAALSRRAGSGPRVELHLLSKPAKETPGEPGLAGSAEPMDELAVEREARLVARRLRQLRDAGHAVWDQAEGRLRPAGWRDMAVLLRSPAGRGEGFAKEFHAAGVPLVAERGGFYRALEVSDLLSLLKLLDNPLQDLPLLAVLRSPLVGLSIDELASIRVHNPERPFWAALRRFHRQTPDRPAGPATGLAWSKIDGFLNAFSRWREQVRQSSLSHGLEAVLLETQYEPLLIAEPRGPERVANVRRLIDLTRQYDPYQRQGLHRFLRFIALQEEEELDLEPATLPGEDAVRLLSIHRSKGLEFPVVVLAGLGSRFNLQDTHAAVLLHQEHGLCPKVLTADGNARYPTLAHWLASRSERRERLGEELRLLYVAMTRARDTLLLVGTAHRKDDARRWRSEPARPLRDREVTSAQGSLDWLRLWLPQITAESDWISETEGRGPLLQWGIHGADDPLLDPEDPSGGATPDPSAVTPALPAANWAALKLRMEWRYPFAAATTERAKASVSALRQSARDELEDEARPLWPFEPERRRQRRDVEAGGLSSAEVGNAHHRFLQWLSLGATADADPLRREAQRLRQEGRLTPAEVEALDLEGLAAFWNSEVGRRIRARADCVQRELPFTARFSPGELARVGVPAQTELPDEEFVVVQGVADLVVILPQEVWILDFKTDDVRRSGLEERAALYRPQLALYALALERIHRRPVRERWLHFIRLRETVRV